GVSYALSPRHFPHIHALDLGVVWKERDATASHRHPPQPSDEEADVRLKDRGEVQSMPLFWRILRREHSLEFVDQRANFVGRGGRDLDPHFVAIAHRCSNLA